MARIIDLDVLAPDDLQVTLHGETYLLPGDIPVPTMLDLERGMLAISTAADQEASVDALEQLHDVVLDLFRIRQPGLEDLPLGLNQTVALVQGLYQGEADGDGGAVDPPKAPSKARAGTRSTTSRPRARTKSGS